jgi:hypothetical protein
MLNGSTMMPASSSCARAPGSPPSPSLNGNQHLVAQALGMPAESDRLREIAGPLGRQLISP